MRWWVIAMARFRRWLYLISQRERGECAVTTYGKDGGIRFIGAGLPVEFGATRITKRFYGVFP